MLSYFSVENFKNFKHKIEWNLISSNNYEFNTEAIQDGCISKGIILGENASGKSNFALALFDIIHHVTDKHKKEQLYINYSNLENENKEVTFQYKFLFDGKEVAYSYAKTSVSELLWERLIIEGKEVVSYDFVRNIGNTTLKGAETLNLISDNKISRIKYIYSNTILESNEENTLFNNFIIFVEKMLMFYSLDTRGYQGLCMGTNDIADRIVRMGELEHFEEFLRRQGICYSLEAKEIDDKMGIYCQFGKRRINFFSIASTGTISLSLLFYWYIQMKNASFVFIDEFDAFYHFRLSKDIILLLRELSNTQIFVTTHNTDLISNDLLRPDCYFIISNDKIHAISQNTDKELRKAHNLQKMYKAGTFDE